MLSRESILEPGYFWRRAAPHSGVTGGGRTPEEEVAAEADSAPPVRSSNFRFFPGLPFPPLAPRV